MDHLINEAANAAYDRTLSKAKRLQRIFLIAGLLLVLIFHFGVRGWDHVLFAAGVDFGHKFNSGLKDFPGLVSVLFPYERALGWVALFWAPGVVIALLVEAFVLLTDWLIHIVRKSEQAPDVLPISGTAERALSQLILREDLSINGIYLVRTAVNKNNKVQCSMETRLGGLLFGLMLLVLLFIRYN